MTLRISCVVGRSIDDWHIRSCRENDRGSAAGIINLGCLGGCPIVRRHSGGIKDYSMSTSGQHFDVFVNEVFMDRALAKS